MLKNILKNYELSNLNLYKLTLNDNDELVKIIKNYMNSIKLELNEENFYTTLMRIVDLNTTLFENTCKKAGINLDKKQAYEITKDFWQKRQNKLLDELLPYLDDFYKELFILIHKIGLVLNSIQPIWDEQIAKNDEFFKSLENPIEFINKHKLYYLDENGEKATRMYALATDLEKEPKILAYSEYFPKEFEKINSYFNDFFEKIHEINSYTKYLKALQNALMSKEHSLKAFQECEKLWMNVKENIQIGHFLEYYEDSFTHSVAFEFDIRINDDYNFSSNEFINQMKNSLKKAYDESGVDAKSALNLSLINLDKSQFFICKPVFFYGAELNGLFSAQVVPNDEFVSAKCGKKIFAFLDFVYQKALAKPKTVLRQKVFSKDYNDYSDSVLNNELLWKKIYEISTIGHEGGHIFFIDSDTESKLNVSGVYKNIEEFKASAGGIYNFLNNFNSDYAKALLQNITSRAINLMAYKDTKELEPYYCEGLIFLDILFKSEVLSDGKETLLNVNLDNFDNFRKEFTKVYEKLSKIYLNKENANNFLSDFAIVKDLKFISKNAKIEKIAEDYRKLYSEFANVKEKV